MKCPQCSSDMICKGEISEDGTVLFYQCPDCKHAKLHARQTVNGFRLAYP
jgi:DNA-directed RNA polymerase subunit M/transcription elongation factor TFIIS